MRFFPLGLIPGLAGMKILESVQIVGEPPAPGTGTRTRGPRSKYFPHQGKAECARRQVQMLRSQAGPSRRALKAA